MEVFMLFFLSYSEKADTLDSTGLVHLKCNSTKKTCAFLHHDISMMLLYCARRAYGSSSAS